MQSNIHHHHHQTQEGEGAGAGQESSSSSSSRHECGVKEAPPKAAVEKYVAGNYKVDMDRIAPFIRRFLKAAVEKGALTQTKATGAAGSFKLGEQPKPKKEKVAKKPKAVAKKPKTPKKAAKKPAAKKAVEKTPKKGVFIHYHHFYFLFIICSILSLFS